MFCNLIQLQECTIGLTLGIYSNLYSRNTFESSEAKNQKFEQIFEDRNLSYGEFQLYLFQLFKKSIILANLTLKGHSNINTSLV